MWNTKDSLNLHTSNIFFGWTPICIVGLLALMPTEVKGQAKVGSVLFPSLIFNNTAASNGMGGASITDVDENSSLHNPGALGVFHLERRFAASIPNSTNTLDGVTDNVRLKTLGASAGYSYRLNSNALSHPILLSVSAAFSRTRLEFGEDVSTSQTGVPLETLEPFSEVNRYTLGFGLEYFVRLGFGVRLERYSESILGFAFSSPGFTELNATANGASVGFYADVTFRLDRQGIGIGRKNLATWSLSLTPAFGYERTISSDELNFDQTLFVIPTPEFENSGGSGLAEISRGNARLFSVRYAEENRDVIFYGDVSPKLSANLHGIEIGLLGTLFYRDGNLDDPEKPLVIETDGYGFRLRGILTWLETLGHLPSKTTKIGWLLRRIDIRYDKAKYNRSPTLASTKIDFAQIVFSM